MTDQPEHTSDAHVLDEDQVGALVRAWRSIEARRLELVDEQVEVKAKIRKLLAPGDKVYVDGKPVSCQANRRFDVERGAALLDPAVREICKAEGYDPRKVKHHLSAALLDACMVEQGEPKVVLA